MQRDDSLRREEMVLPEGLSALIRRQIFPHTKPTFRARARRFLAALARASSMLRELADALEKICVGGRV